MGLAFLVPRGGKCCLDVSYKGMAATLKTYGAIKHIDGHVVYEDDTFEYRPDLGTLTHIPYIAKSEEEQKARKIVGAYARAVLPDSLIVFEFIPAWELEKIKAVSQAASKGFSPYNNWEGEMIRKAPIKRLAKKLHVLQNEEQVRAMFESIDELDKTNNAPKINEDWADYTEVSDGTGV
jgi:recombination protein RecT